MSNNASSAASDKNLQLSDVTTNDVSTSKHGFVPKATNTGNFLKDDGTWAAIPGGGDALTSNPLSQFASTTSLQLKGVLSDETGSGAAVFANSPALVTPTGIVKGDVGLGNVDNTADTAKPVSTAQQTALNLKANLASPTFTGTVTIPTGASITAPTGIVKGDVGLGNVDNTSDATKNAASVTLTNKTIDGDDNTLQDISETSLKNGGTLRTINNYTADATWTKPAGLRYVIVEVVGGGGGGGGTTGAASNAGIPSGGGGGGYSMKKVVAASLGSTEAVTVGAAGTAGTAGTNDGGVGGTSSFGTHLQATGGLGGGGEAAHTHNIGAAPVAGGVGSLGDINLSGSPSRAGQSDVANSRAISSGGGDAAYGYGAGATPLRQGGAGGSGGGDGKAYGGGGGGGISENNTTSRAGGAGAAGLVVVREYF